MSGPECGTLRALFVLLHCRERACSGCLGELDLHDLFDPDGPFSNYNIAEKARGEVPAFSTSPTASAVGASSIPHASEGRGSTDENGGLCAVCACLETSPRWSVRRRKPRSFSLKTA